jgi:hypothetical protein
MFLLLASLLLAQTTYKWIDKDGEIHVTTSPPPADSPSAVLPPARAEPPKGVHAAESAPTPKRHEIPYLGREGDARRVIVPVRFNGRVTAPMALDTGSPGLIISQSLAEKLDLFSRAEGALIVNARGVGGTELAVLSLVDDVAIGDAEQRMLPVTVMTGSLSSKFDGVVGMDFMAQYSMTIDSARQVVVLQELDASDAPGGHPEAWWRDVFAEFRGQRDQWTALIARLDRDQAEHRPSELDAGSLEKLRKGARVQLEEAEKLLARLERYASSVSVPRQWR